MEDFKIVSWPDIQYYMDIEGFDDNSALITPNKNLGIDSCTYLISKDWLDEITK